ncbi:hypothetical protein LDO26_08030 [Luteimonas sp. BDR2-5]|uniref:hypothetical protein n=1 Tax=Proluteimonas luteida TaxID=2878685 RepID=UPI001E3B9149|nr:hypothetical protein [Luteimonas sp. BDR2-5]MCD9028156.1 hypothetical protein [Luteimonas sp. BDR2-5]
MSERWQYKVQQVEVGTLGGVKPEVVEEHLQRLGQQGWERVNAVHVAGRPVLPFLKRRA